MVKLTKLLTFVTIATAFVAAVIAAPATEAAEVTLVCAHDHPTTKGAEGQREIELQTFKKYVEEHSNGRIAVKVIGAGQLGDMPEIYENLRLGTVDCSGFDAATAGPFIKEYSFVGAPLVIQSKKHADLLSDPNRPYFKTIAKLMRDRMKVVAIGAFSVPPRNIYSNKRPVTKPEDLKGLKFRTMQSKIQLRSWEALGAAPMAVAFQELYGALQTGVVDAAENPAFLVWGTKQYETIDYYSLTRHQINTGMVVVTESGLNKVPKDLRQVVIDAGPVAAAAGTKYVWDSNEKFIDLLKGAGIKVVEVDNKPFVDKIAPLHDELAKEFGAEGLLKIIREEAANL
jgi:tripartite ATP-independent transporter DctP family solute receptor